MMSTSRGIPQQIKRLAVAIALIVGTVLTVVFGILPPSMTQRGLHRKLTVEREVAKPAKFATAAECEACHEDKATLKKTGFHRNLSCETCHGPSRAHMEDPMSVKPITQDQRKFCPACHAYNPARPTGFPQINPTLHNPMQPCASCHNPHDPKPPTVPQECSACHAQIARTKLVSKHALVECTECHNVPQEHREAPRVHEASKPETRDFCGKCHGEGGKQSAGPKVDMATHGERYLCWQCHYPHQPGGA